MSHYQFLNCSLGRENEQDKSKNKQNLKKKPRKSKSAGEDDTSIFDDKKSSCRHIQECAVLYFLKLYRALIR